MHHSGKRSPCVVFLIETHSVSQHPPFSSFSFLVAFWFLSGPFLFTFGSLAYPSLSFANRLSHHVTLKAFRNYLDPGGCRRDLSPHGASTIPNASSSLRRTRP